MSRTFGLYGRGFVKARRLNLLAIVCLTMALIAPGKHAQAANAGDYPSKPVTIVVPYSAGGATDILARVVGRKLSERWRVAVVVDNKPGAGGSIGTALVARSAPDGYTLVMGSIGTHAINPHIYASLPYDALKDFSPITRTAMVPNVLVVNAGSPFTTVAELGSYAKAHPRELTFGSSGHGSTLHLSGELYKMMAQVDAVHVPYKGSAPAVADLLGNRLTMIFDNLPSSLPHIRAGKLRALAVTSAERASQLPDVPTMTESGVRGYEVMSWFGLWAPSNTPRSVVRKINAAVVEILGTPELRATLIDLGATPSPESPESFDRFVRAEYKKWDGVVMGAKIEPI